MTRIVRGLSVFCESFSKCTFSFSYVLFLTSFAFYHINQVRRFARHLLFDFSYFPVLLFVSFHLNPLVQTLPSTSYKILTTSLLMLYLSPLTYRLYTRTFPPKRALTHVENYWTNELINPFLLKPCVTLCA